MVSGVIKQIEESFGKMSEIRGEDHEFVGMNLKMNHDGNISISISDYLRECIASFGEKFNGGASTPA